MSFYPFAATPLLSLQTATPTAGFALQNGTPTILTWTVPNDGLTHRVMFIASLHVTSLETGGQVNASLSFPDGLANSPQLFAGGLSAGGQGINAIVRVIQAGSTVTVAQQSALTGGAATLWCEIWGS